MQLIESSSSVLKAGDTYGRYTVLGVFKASNGYQKYAHVSCACGSSARFVQVGVLRNGGSKSCGCFHKEQVTKHGDRSNPVFICWKSMIDRCTNPKNKSFHRYGGRGITISTHWLDHRNFMADMEPSFEEGMTIDRIDNSGPYTLENCRWATKKTQNRNYSRNHFITYQGETRCLKEWAEIFGINHATLSDRIRVQKLPPHIAFTKILNS